MIDSGAQRSPFFFVSKPYQNFYTIKEGAFIDNETDTFISIIVYNP